MGTHRSAVILIVLSACVGRKEVVTEPPPELPERSDDALRLVTFNAWALDGYQKVFWYETELVALWPQVSVLAGLGVVFLVTARRLARRWERG